MRIYVIPDIHGMLDVLKKAMSLIEEDLQSEDTKLVFLGDYIHGGEDSIGVLDYIMNLQQQFGEHKIIALLGNHEDFVLNGYSSLEDITPQHASDIDGKYLAWLRDLPKYHLESKTIFVHAGVDEYLGEHWEYTDDYTFINKYPPVTGKIEGVDLQVVAGHVYTSEIVNDPYFCEIYYDGFNHYYLDGDVVKNKALNIMLVETGDDKDTYFQVTPEGNYIISKYY